MGLSGSQKAIMYALGGVARGGATRGGYTTARVFLSVNGVQYAETPAFASKRVVASSLSVIESLNDVANTASFDMRGIKPSDGQQVVVSIGSINNPDRVFAGIVLNEGVALQADAPASSVSTVNAIDFTWLLTRRRFSGSFTSTSPAVIAAAIVAVVPGVTLFVEAGLADLDAFSISDKSALSALQELAKRVGGYCDVDYHKVVRLFVTNSAATRPTALTTAHPTLHEVSYVRDLSQVVTRWFVDGGGSPAAASIPIGATELPVNVGTRFNAAGGTARTGAQSVTYTGVSADADKGTTSTGILKSPSTPTSSISNVLAGRVVGAVSYGVSYVSADGESELSSASTPITGTQIPTPTAGPLTSSPGGTTYNVDYAVTCVDADGNETAMGPLGTATTASSVDPNIGINVGSVMAGPTSPWAADTRVKSWRLYRRQLAVSPAVPSGDWFLVTTISDGTTTTYTDHTSIVLSGTPMSHPTVNQTGGVASVTISNGPTGTLTKKVYRTSAGSSVMQFLQTVNDNTTTAVTDKAPDSALGAVAPSGSQVKTLAGSTTLTIADLAQASEGLGWAKVGSQVVKFTGRSGSSGIGTLTGIPATGTGALASDVTAGTAVTFIPFLKGIPSSGAGSILYAITQGDAVTLRVMVEDATAQTALAALIGGSDDGIVEDSVSGGDISEAESLSLGNAKLALSKNARVTIDFKTRDRTTHVGATITVTWSDPINLSQDFLIQHLTVSGWQPGKLPFYSGQASTDRFSLENLLMLTRKG